MRPVSAAFLRTVASSHKMVARATACTVFQTGTQPLGTRVSILGGEVTLDGTADIRGSLDLTVPGELWPVFATDPLAPYGQEVYVERGIAYSDEQVEYVGLGYFRIQSPEQDDAPAGPVRIEARDRMAGIVDARLLAPLQFPSNTTIATVFNTLVKQVYPDAVIVFDDGSGSNLIGRGTIVEEDRFGFLDNIVKSLGKVWYWNHRGELTIRSVPAPDYPVLEVESGAGGALIGMRRKLTRDKVYNAVVASGEATTDGSDPVRGVAVDANPGSPTYFYGRFGPVPRFYSSSFLASNEQAAAAAAAMLRRSLGLPKSVDFTAVPNPALEPWDPVRLRPRDDRPAEVHVIESLTIPLVEGGELKAQTREQTVVLIGSG